MLIKDRNNNEGAIEQLRELLSLNLSSKKKFLIERELKNLNPGHDGGRNASHFINFYCGDSRDWAVIHDLNLENKGLSTQIDHLLINQFLDIYIIESKNYAYSLKIKADGEFLVFDGKRYQSIASPIEKNQQRVQVLEQMLIENKLTPKKMGILRKPLIRPYVLVSSDSNIVRPPVSIYDTRSVITVAYLIAKLLNQADRIRRIYQGLKRFPKLIKTDTLTEFASRLVSLHKPNQINYHRLFCPEVVDKTLVADSPGQNIAVDCDYTI